MKKHTTSSIYSVLVAADFATVETDFAFDFDAARNKDVLKGFIKVRMGHRNSENPVVLTDLLYPHPRRAGGGA